MLVKIKTWNILDVTTYLLNLCIKFEITNYKPNEITVRLPDSIHKHHLDGVMYRNSDNAYYGRMAMAAGVVTPW